MRRSRWHEACFLEGFVDEPTRVRIEQGSTLCARDLAPQPRQLGGGTISAAGMEAREQALIARAQRVGELGGECIC